MFREQMQPTPGRVNVLETKDCTIVSINTNDEAHEWCKVYGNIRAAANEICNLGLISSREADFLVADCVEIPCVWGRAVDLYPKNTGKLGFTYMPTVLGGSH